MLGHTKYYIILGAISGYLIGYGPTQDHLFASFMMPIGVGIALYFRYIYSFKSKPSAGYLGNEEQCLDYILMLASLVVKADGKIDQKEKDWIEEKLRDDFYEKYAEEFMSLFEFALEKSLSLEKVCDEVILNFDFPARINLLHFLVRICMIDNIITHKEYEIIRKIALALHLTEKQLNAVLAMFDHRREENREKSKGQNRPDFSSSLSLKKCYEILELDETASDGTLKKTFRKLAIIHHPDKVAHLGEEFQMTAKEKFQKILEAYELIKVKRGID